MDNDWQVDGTFQQQRSSQKKIDPRVISLIILVVNKVMLTFLMHMPWKANEKNIGLALQFSPAYVFKFPGIIYAFVKVPCLILNKCPNPLLPVMREWSW